VPCPAVVDPVVVGAGRREALRLGEDVVVLLEEDVEEWALGVGRERVQVRLGDVDAGRSDPAPDDAASMPPECHAEVVEVPQDRTQGPQVVDAEDEVESAQADAEAADGKLLLADMHGHVAGHRPAWHAVTVGHRHSQPGARCRQTETAHQILVDEVVCRAAVEEGRQTVSADVDRDHHRVLGANAGDGVEGDNRVRLLSRLGASAPGRSIILAIGRVVGHL